MTFTRTVQEFRAEAKPRRLLAAALASGLVAAPAVATPMSTSAPRAYDVAADDAKLAQRRRSRRARGKKGAGDDAEARPRRGDSGATPEAVYAKGIGFSVRKLTSREKQEVKRRGLMVGDVQRGLAAHESGLQEGDVITSIDGKDLLDPELFVDVVKAGEEGQTYKLAIIRAGVDTSVDLRLPGESREEREEREKKEEEEREKQEEEEREREEEERREREEEEEREREEAEEDRREREEELEEAREEREEELEEAREREEEAREERERLEDLEGELEEATEDKFGLGYCCIASFLCPGLTPVWVIIMLLVENEPQPMLEPETGKEVPRRALAQNEQAILY